MLCLFAEHSQFVISNQGHLLTGQAKGNSSIYSNYGVVAEIPEITDNIKRRFAEAHNVHSELEDTLEDAARSVSIAIL